MKKALTIAGFLLCFMLFHGRPGYSQTQDTTNLVYADGARGLQRLMLNEVSGAEIFNNRDFYKIHHIYYEVQFRIDKAGNLGEQITINSVNDTALRQNILTAMKKTRGLWINHTGHEILAILPIHLYNDSGDTKSTDSTMKILPLRHAAYDHWEESKIMYLTTIEIQSYPPVNKTSLNTK